MSGPPRAHPPIDWSTLASLLAEAGELLPADSSLPGLEGQPPNLPPGALAGVRVDDRELGEPSRESDLDWELFVAIRGVRHDTHASLDRLPGTAVAAVISEDPLPSDYPLPRLRVRDSREALGLIEHARRGDPAREVETFGITGTNGKSSTVRVLVEILRAAGRRPGWWTTVDRFSLGAVEGSAMTTPGAAVLAETLSDCRRRGGDAMVIEVSSHALEQRRVAGIPFRGGALTQLSRDHLDYHGSMEAYRAAKLRLGRLVLPGAPFVLPVGAPFEEALQPLDAEVFRHSLDPAALGDRRGGTVRDCELRPDGIAATLDLMGEVVEIESELRGRHNLENILTAATLARAVGIEGDAIRRGVLATRPVAGRLEEIASPVGRILVDYAHTPDALDAVLHSMRACCPGRLLTVFGCGGDRDRGKRPEMGAAAARHADSLFITSDNPRTEAPEAIIEEILAGLPAGCGSDRVVVEPDRRAAIARAIAALEEGDILVVAGKGHETEQIVGSQRLHFDDREVIRSLVADGGRSR